MIVTVIVVLLAVWIAVGAVVALLIGRTARVADSRQHDAMLLGLRASTTAAAPKPKRVPARV